MNGKPTPQALIERGVVPFLKIDKGLEDEENGVQLMKPIPGPRHAARARKGARRIRYQGALGHQFGERGGYRGGGRPAVPGREAGARHGMVPIIEPEVNIKSADRAESDELLLTAILEELDEIAGRAARHAEAVDSREARLVPPLDRASEGAPRRRAVGRILAVRKLAASWPRTRA